MPDDSSKNSELNKGSSLLSSTVRNGVVRRSPDSPTDKTGVAKSRSNNLTAEAQNAPKQSFRSR